MRQIKGSSYLYKIYCEAPTFSTSGLNKEELIFRYGRIIKPEVISRNLYYKAGRNPLSFEAAKRRYVNSRIIGYVKTGRLNISENGNYVLVL